MARPENLKYTPSHEWCRVEGALATVGITDFAVEQLSDLVFVDLPKVGATVEKGGRFGEVESTKTVSDLIAPVSGTIEAVNGEPPDHPEIISESPFDRGWMIVIRMSRPEEAAGLLDAKAYQALIDEAAE